MAFFQPKIMDLSTRLWGITAEFVGFIPQSLALRSIDLGRILVYKLGSCILKDKHNSLHLVVCFSKLLELRIRKTVRFSELIMSTDKYQSIFPHQMEAIVYIASKRYPSSSMTEKVSVRVHVSLIAAQPWEQVSIPAVVCTCGKSNLPYSIEKKNLAIVRGFSDLE